MQLMPHYEYAIARCGRAIVVSALAAVATLVRSAPAAGQSEAPAVPTQAVTPAALVGTWVWLQWSISDTVGNLVGTETVFTFRADSSIIARWRRNGVEETSPEDMWSTWHWSWGLRGDTLDIVGSAGAKAYIMQGRVTRAGEHLLWKLDKRVGKSARTIETLDGRHCTDTLRRADASKPLPPPPAPPKGTVERTALIGTWVGGYRDASDTLTLRADSTFSYINQQATLKGQWRLYPSDVLWLKEKGESRIRLNGDQLFYDECNGWVFKRVSP